MLLGKNDTSLAPLPGARPEDEAPVFQLWRELHTRLLSYVRRRVHDDDTAQDILQEVFLRAQEGFRSGAVPRNRSAWIYGIARHLIADHFRDEAMIHIYHNDYLHDTAARGAEREFAATTSVEKGELPLNMEIGRCLTFLTQDLARKYREPFHLALHGNITQREIGERLGLSVAGAKARIQRARKQLKQLLDACCEVQLDRRGNILDYRPRKSDCTKGCSCREIKSAGCS